MLDPKTRQPLTFARQGEPLPDAAANTGNSTARRTFDLPYTEWGLKHWKEYDPVKNGEYTASCLPFGMSRNINSPHGLVIVHHPDSLAFLFEQNTWFHWVPTQRDEVARRSAAELERRLDRTLGRRHADYRDHPLQRLHEPGHHRASAQQGTDAHQHLHADRCRDDAAHGHGPRSEDVHAGLDERADLADQDLP